jgi:hypothetical protein
MGTLPQDFIPYAYSAMKYPDLIPIYAHLLCSVGVSEVIEDAAQHLFQRAFDTGALQLGEGSEQCPESTMLRLLQISTADAGLRRLANRLEGMLLKEFSDEINAEKCSGRRLDARKTVSRHNPGGGVDSDKSRLPAAADDC